MDKNMDFIIGAIKPDSRLLLAPVAGFTDSPFRRIARAHGACITFTELISAEGIVRKNSKSLELMKFSAAERPLGIQIFGNRPEVMADAAAYAESTGPDLIDINLGCPAIKVCKSGEGSGAALLLKPELIYKIASAVVKSVKIPVTAKMRIGWDGKNMHYMECVKALEDSGISMITVHGRTRAQKYKGPVNWEIINEIAGASRLPVIGNGDIESREQALSIIEKGPCSGVMIGRKALGNPWIFSGRRPSPADIIEQIAIHINLMTDYYGQKGIILMRKHLVRYIHGFKNASRLRAELMKAENSGEIIEKLRLTLKE